MNETKKERDILDFSAGEIPAENRPVSNVERPTVAPAAKQSFLADFLDGEKKPEHTNTHTPPLSEAADTSELEDRIVDTLKEIYDPEIPVDIYELGLIYGVEVDDNNFATVTMTLTTPHCPVAETMPGEVELRVSSVPGVMGAEVRLVWDPPWDMSRMTDEARLELGLL